MVALADSPKYRVIAVVAGPDGRQLVQLRESWGKTVAHEVLAEGLTYSPRYGAWFSSPSGMVAPAWRLEGSV